METAREEMKPVRLYDLGNTLVTMDHAGYVFGRNPGLRQAYEAGDVAANLEYEQILEEGLCVGNVHVAALAGVREKLAADSGHGTRNAVFSTCLPRAIVATTRQAGIDTYLSGIFSTFDYNHPKREKAMKTAHTKTPQGFGAVNAALDGRVISFADDKIAELERARKGLGPRAMLYKILKEGEMNIRDSQVIDGTVRSIADIAGEYRRRMRQGV